MEEMEELEAYFAQAPSIAELRLLAMPGSGSALERILIEAVPDLDHLRGLGVTSVRERVRFDLLDLLAGVPPTHHPRALRLHRASRPERSERLLGQGEGEHWAAIVSLLEQRKPGASRIEGSSHLELDLGLDSLHRAEFLLASERATGATLLAGDLQTIETLDDLMVALEHRRRGGVSGADARPPLSPGSPGSPGAPGAPARSAHDDLLAPLSDEERLSSLGPGSGPLSTATYRLIQLGIRLLGSCLLRLSIRGLEKLPERGPYILCPNHQSYIDPLLLAALLPWSVARRLYFLAYSSYVVGPISSRIASFARTLPVDCEGHLRQSMRAAAAVLRRGGVLGIFPEGGRTADGCLGELREGAAMLAVELGVPLVPVRCEGLWDAWPRYRRFPRPARVSLSVGDPHIAERAPGETSWQAHARVTSELRAAILGLGVPPSRGILLREPASAHTESPGGL